MLNEFTENEKNAITCRECQCKNCKNNNCPCKCSANIPCFSPVKRCKDFK